MDNPTRIEDRTLTVTTIARYTCEPGDRDGVLDALAPARRATVEEEGCQYFIVLTPEDDPNGIVLVEGWRSSADLEAHRRTPHFRKIILRDVAERVAQRSVATFDQISMVATV